MFALPVAVSFIKPIVFWGSRYLIIAVPPMIALLALGAAGRRRLPALALLAIVVAGQCFYLQNYFRYRQKHTWDTVADFLDKNAEPGETIWVLRAWNVPLFERYLKTAHPVKGADSVAEVAARLDPGPQYVVSNTNFKDAFAEYKIPTLLTQIFETHRPRQELYVLKIIPGKK